MNEPQTKSGASRQGQAAVALRARAPRVLRALAKQTPVMAALVGPPGLAAAAEGQSDLAVALLGPAILLMALFAFSRQTDPNGGDLRRIEAIATLALLFVVSTVLAVPAFMVLGMSWLDALFESTSGITSTGLTVARDAESWPIAGHFLRAWNQWCGGLAIAIAGVALLMDSGRAARVMGAQSLGGADYIASTRGKARIVLGGYALITLIAVLISIPLFPGWWEGPMVALAAVSTGGFTPRSTSLAEYSRAAQIFTMALCLATTISLLFYALAWKVGLRDAFSRGTVKTTLAITAVGTALALLISGWTHGWAWDSLLDSALNHISAQTTAGFTVAPIAPASPLLFIMTVAMILGGDVGSTTGGIKTQRTTILYRMVALIFLRLRLPDRAVSHLKIGHNRVEAESILLAGALLSIYLVAMVLFWLLLYLAGHPALPALFDAVSALSTVGLSAGVIGPDLAPHLKAAAIVAMMLGRLEFFALIVLFLPTTWISRR